MEEEDGRLERKLQTGEKGRLGRVSIIMTSGPAVIGRNRRALSSNRARRRRSGFGPVLAMAFLTACSGDLSHRSVAELSGVIEIPPATREIRLEIRNGTVGVDVHADRNISYGGGVRRAASTAETLAAIEAVPLEFRAMPDASDPGVLVIRGPEIGPEIRGLLALELGLRLPAELPVEIVVEENGHVTAARRRAPVVASTGRGDLRFERCEAAIDARTGRGNVIAFDHAGDLELETAVGDMQVFVRRPADRIRLDTGEGTVQCYIPATSGFRLDARAQIGKCGNSFGFPVERPSEYGAVMTGSRGDGRTEILLRTGKGALSLSAKSFE